MAFASGTVDSRTALCGMDICFSGWFWKGAVFPLHVWFDAHSTAPARQCNFIRTAVKGYLICLLKILYNVFGRH